MIDDDPSGTAPHFYIHPHLTVRPSPLGGLGLFATAPIKKGTVVNVAEDNLVYVPDVRLLTPLQVNFCYQVDADHFVCPRDVEHPTPDWYTNHSCEPNIGPRNDPYTMVAIRDIAAGEEVTYDYAMTETETTWSMECRCGSAHCRGTIRGNDWQQEELQKRYAPHFVPDILAKIGFATA